MEYSSSSAHTKLFQQTNEGQLALTPTDLSNAEYCPRLLQLARRHQDRRPMASPYLVWGSYEHEVFRVLPQLLAKSWRSASFPQAISLVSLGDIDDAMEFADQLIMQNHPQYQLGFDVNRGELRYRLQLWLHECQQQVEHLMAAGMTFDAAMSRTLPWKVEDKLSSKKLGLYGRTDRLFSDGESITPEDIKTHDTRFTTLLHCDAHKVQLLCYSVMAEEKYGLPSSKSRIFFSRDLSRVEFEITTNDKTGLEQRVDQARRLLSEELVPILTGPEAIKCRHCYLRELCQTVERKQKEAPGKLHDWIDRLLDPGESVTDLFGGSD